MMMMESSWWNWKAAYDCNFEFNLRDNYHTTTTTAKIPIIKMTKVVQAGRQVDDTASQKGGAWMESSCVLHIYTSGVYLFSPSRYRKVHVRLQSVIIRIEFLPIPQNTHLYLLTIKNIYPTNALEISFSPSLCVHIVPCVLTDQPTVTKVVIL